MTPQEKANALVFLYVTILDSDDTKDGYMTIVTNAERCALMAVNEILSIKALSLMSGWNGHEQSELQYWQQVKTEIEKL